MLVCVNCGSEIRSVVKHYSPQILEVLKCRQCQKTADHYVECDNTIIFLDVVLLRISAFRHLLYNEDGFSGKWTLRLIALTSLSEAYHHWAIEHAKEQPITAALEFSFYQKLLSAIIGQLWLTFLIVMMFTVFSGDMSFRRAKTLFEGVSLSGFSILYLLIVHVWMRDQAIYWFGIVKLYRAMACCQILKAMTRYSTATLILPTAVACGTEYLVSRAFR